MRLIDADKCPCTPCYEEYCGITCPDYNEWFGTSEDAVTVVRCKDCKKRYTVDCPMYIEHDYYDEDDGWDFWYEDLTEDGGFCFYGERKEGAE